MQDKFVKKATRFFGSDWGIYGTRGLVVGLNLVSMLVIALLMAPADFGVFAFSFSAALTLSAVVSIGVPAFLLREFSAAKSLGRMGLTRGQFLRLVLLWPTGILAISVIFVFWLQMQFPNQLSVPLISKHHIFLTASVSGLVNLVAVLASFFRVEGYTGTAMIFRDAMPQGILLVATLAAAAISQPDPTTVFGIGAILLLFSLCAGVYYLKREIREQLSKLRKNKSRLSLFGFWGTAVTNMAWTQVDILVGGLFLNAATLGEYQIIKRIANFANMPQIVANWAVVVGIGRAFAKNQKQEIQSHARKAIQLSAWPLLAINAVLLVGGTVILSWFDIEMTSEIWLLFALLLIGSSANVLFGANFVVASQCKLEKSAFLSRLLGLASCAALILLIEPAEPAYVATAYVCGIVISNAWLWLRIRKILEVDTSIFSLYRKTGLAV